MEFNELTEAVIEEGALQKQIFRSSHWRCSIKKGVLTNFTKFTRKTCTRVSFLIKLQASVCNFLKKETPTQEFSCEFCKILRTPFFSEHLWTTASRYSSK